MARTKVKRKIDGYGSETKPVKDGEVSKEKEIVEGELWESGGNIV